MSNKNGFSTIQRQRARAQYVDWYGDECWWCIEQPVQSIDHLIPRALGGCNHQHNLVGACFECNNVKGSEFWPDVPYEQWTELWLCSAVSNDQLKRVLLDWWRPRLF